MVNGYLGEWAEFVCAFSGVLPMQRNTLIYNKLNTPIEIGAQVLAAYITCATITVRVIGVHVCMCVCVLAGFAAAAFFNMRSPSFIQSK